MHSQKKPEMIGFYLRKSVLRKFQKENLRDSRKKNGLGCRDSSSDIYAMELVKNCLAKKAAQPSLKREFREYFQFEK